MFDALYQYYLAGKGGIPTQVVSSPITFTSTVSYNVVRKLSVTSTLNLSQATYRIIPRTVSSVITFTQSAVAGRAFARSVSSTLVFTQNVTRSPITYSVSSVLNLTQSVRVNGSVFRRSVSSFLEFHDPFLQYIPVGNVVITVPAAQFSLVTPKCQVLIGTPDLGIALPCPLFGDSQANLSTLVIKRTMTGETYTYVKNSVLNKISYTFEITRPKSAELRNYLVAHLSDMMTLINWKGEVWSGFITNNPVEMITQGRADPTNELIDVTIDFEGVKTGG